MKTSFFTGTIPEDKRVSFEDTNTGVMHHFEHGDIIRVFIRKANSSKKLIFVTKDIYKAFKFFYMTKVFKNDYRYIERDNGSDIYLVLRTKGDTELLRSRHGLPRTKRYDTKRLNAIETVPVTLMDAFDARTSRNKTHTISLLMAHFCSLDAFESKIFLAEADKKLLKHKYLSGMTDREEVVSILDDLEEDELL